MNAQGEDVVAGTARRGRPSINSQEPGDSLEAMPRAYEGADRVQKKLETHYRDMQDLEFTIEDGRSTCSRPAPASAPAGRDPHRRRHGPRGLIRKERR
jgi:hypothetical protein